MENTIQTIIANFNLTYILITNILTYIIISIIDRLNGKHVVTFWQKRLILLISIIAIGIVYYVTDTISIVILINSAIAAPVFWSWVIKPIISNTRFDYKQVDKYLK